VCPECREPLIALELEGVEIDYCVVCRGTWLDEGELEQIAALAGVATGPLSQALHTAVAGPRSRRRCPRCRRKLRSVSVGRQQPVTVDRCPLGHGLWLDRGEAKALILSAAGDEAGTVGEFLSDLLRHELGADAKGEQR